MHHRTVVGRLGLEGRLQTSVVAVGLLLVGMGTVVAAEIEQISSHRDALRNVSLGLALVAGVSFLTDHVWSPGARWFSVSAVVAIVHIAASAIGLPAALTLAVVPITLSIPLLSFPAALAAGTVETSALVFFPGFVAPGVDGRTRAVLVLLLWSAIGGAGLLLWYFEDRLTWLHEQRARSQAALLQKQASEAQLAEVANALAHANRQLLAANDRAGRLRTIAEDAERAKSAFVARVSHEFRTPLNMIIGLSELMTDAPETYAIVLPPEMQHDIETVLRNCRHLASLVDDVLDLTRVQAGRMSLHKDRVDLASIVHSAVAAVRPLVEKKRLRIAIDLPEDVPLVYCDRARIRQVVLNLLSNAARFTDAGRIEVGAHEVGQRVFVHVSDTGTGIPEESVARVFEPFYQSQVGVPHDGAGSGLGLSISQQFVKLHGGRMWVESRLGKGSTFHFFLPVSPPLEPSSEPGQWIRDDWIWRETAFRTDKAGLAEAETRPQIAVWDGGGGLKAELPRYADDIDALGITDVAHLSEDLADVSVDAVILNCDDAGALLELVPDVADRLGGAPIVGCMVPRRTRRAHDAGAIGYLVKPISCADLARALRQADGPVRRVLVVDDDEDVLRLLPRLLHLIDNSLEVDGVTSGWNAIERLRRDSYDLVLLDVLLPDLDGWEVMARLRREGIPETPVVFVSAQDPDDGPVASSLMLASVRGGISVDRLLGCALRLGDLLLSPEQALREGMP